MIAFEPLPGKATFLRSIHLPRQVEIREMALGTRTGTMEFLHIVDAPQESGLRARTSYNVPTPHSERISVQVSTLDAELRAVPAVDFIKIDIEGGEMDCLRGGMATLERNRPVISVEFGGTAYGNYGVKDSDLFDFATSLGYVVTDLFGNAISSKDEWLQIVNHAYWDYFLFPQEKLCIAERGLATLPTRKWSHHSLFARPAEAGLLAKRLSPAFAGWLARSFRKAFR